MLALLLLTAPMADPAPKPTVADLAWMTGSWKSANGGVETEENWIAPKGGILLGTNRVVVKKQTFFEFLRIAETDAGLSYFASPMGKPATEFALKSLEKDKVTFENAKHDWPQRVIYWKVDGKLHARVEGIQGGKERIEEWVWE